MLWLMQNNILIRNAIMVTNDNLLTNLHVSILENSLSNQIILDAHKTIKEQEKTKIDLNSFFDDFDTDIMLIDDLFIHTTTSVFKNFMNNKFNDFYFFATQILKNIMIEQIEYYDINELTNLKNICKKIDCDEKYTTILENIDTATKNSKILSLAYKISLK